MQSTLEYDDDRSLPKGGQRQVRTPPRKMFDLTSKAAILLYMMLDDVKGLIYETAGFARNRRGA